jgi:predicted RNase H-like nuclease (RuvC/YqgF family)
MIQAAALTPALAIEDVSGRVEQSPLAAVVDELQAEVDMLKAEVYELKEELKLVKTGVARDEELETLQNEIRALKEQLTAQTRPRLTPAQIVHVSG